MIYSLSLYLNFPPLPFVELGRDGELGRGAFGWHHWLTSKDDENDDHGDNDDDGGDDDDDDDDNDCDSELLLEKMVTMKV